MGKEIYILNQQSSIAQTYLNELRDVEIQKDSMRFRHNLQRLGFLLAYEASKTLDYTPHEVTTPLGTSSSQQPKDDIVVTTILRAGIPMYDGVLQAFDRAQSAFIGSYRASEGTEDVSIVSNYIASDNLDGKIVLVVDPMLATGSSLWDACEKLLQNGTPKAIHLIAAIGAQEGVDFMTEKMATLNIPFHLWIGAVDPSLNEKHYIVPGLGDAGDLCFGPKL
ncbi:uracil phosphoribosyltransferase [Algivirga pacifica]|uniref:Uracil phosphoribosyltransferase n=1 Tax=Algivirga pacifica TaxID=1162670 RepID=A0ABP9DBU4_9BACT